MRPPASLAIIAVLALTGCLPAEWGASAILHPTRRPVPPAPVDAQAIRIEGGGPVLEGWLFRTTTARRGLVIYLHGSADNRASGVWLARRLTAAGYDVLTYDSRAHGRSDGSFCTYGFHEKGDVSRALDAVGAQGAILLGVSMGGSVALQAAVIDRRIRGVIAVAPFSTLRRILHERARALPWPVTEGQVKRAIARAEAKAAFRVDEVSPVQAAAQLAVPVLLLHGGEDEKIVPDHSRVIHGALRGKGELKVIPGAGHDDVLGRPEAWTAVAAFLDAVPPDAVR